MSTALIIVIAVGAIVLAWLLFLAIRSRRAKQAAEQERLGRQAEDHRAQADAGISRAREAGAEVERHQVEAERHVELSEVHAAKADEHAEAAAEAQAAVNRSGNAAGRHDAEAAELEDKLK